MNPPHDWAWRFTRVLLNVIPGNHIQTALQHMIRGLCVANLELGLRWLHDRGNELHCTMGCLLETGEYTCCHYKG